MQDHEDRNERETEPFAGGQPSDLNADQPAEQQTLAERPDEAAAEAEPEAPAPTEDPYPYGGAGQGNNGGNGGYPYGNAGPYGNGGYPYGGYPSGGRRANPYAYEEQENSGKKKGLGGKIFIIAAVAILMAVVVLIIYGVATRSFSTGSRKVEEGEKIDNVDEIATDETPEVRTDAQKASSADALAPNEIYQKVLPSSVGILVYGSGKKLVSEGSGVIFKEDNSGEYTYIVSCAHVISDKGVSIMVQTSDEKEYAAQVVGFDNKTDIGVVRIKAKGLEEAQFGDSKKLRVGDIVYAIGNPGGTEFANSFTNGMISAIERPVSSDSTGYTMECIQHTAAINPGNSGGALVNSLGQVIGINSMKIVADDYEGMGFSVPSSVFVDVVNEIVANGYVTNRPKIGITYRPASAEQAYAMFVGIKGLPAGSIIVYSIASDSSLANTKLQKGDLIVGVNGKDLTSSSDLAEMVEKGKVGDTMTLNVVRINNDYTYEEFDVEATLVEDKGDTNLLEEEEPTTSYFDNYFDDDNGDSFGFDGGLEDFFREFYGNR